MDRIQQLRELIKNQFHNNQAEFARAIDRSPSQVHQLLSGRRNLGDAIARHIEMTLELGEGWIDGLAPVKNQPKYPTDLRTNENIPVITWETVGNSNGVPFEIEPNDINEWVASTCEHSPFAFALKVQGESMVDNSSIYSFNEGEIILIDPKLTPRNGDFVIVKPENDTQAFFKKLIIEGSRKYLKSLNPNWPEPIKELKKGTLIYGVIFEKNVKLR